VRKQFFLFFLTTIIFAFQTEAHENSPDEFTKFYTPKTYFGEKVLGRDPQLRWSLYSVLPEGIYLEKYATGVFGNVKGIDLSAGLTQGDDLQIYADASKNFLFSGHKFKPYAIAHTPFPSLLPTPQEEKLLSFERLDINWGLAHSWQIYQNIFFEQKFDVLYNPQAFQYDKLFGTYTASMSHHGELWQVSLNFIAQDQFPQPSYETDTYYTATASFSLSFCGLFEECKKKSPYP